jgi:hypothetical protein
MFYMFQAVFLPIIRSSNCKHSICYMSSLLAVVASRLDIYQMLCIQFELLMMDGKTA